MTNNQTTLPPAGFGSEGNVLAMMNEYGTLSVSLFNTLTSTMLKQYMMAMLAAAVGAGLGVLGALGQGATSFKEGLNEGKIGSLKETTQNEIDKRHKQNAQIIKDGSSLDMSRKSNKALDQVSQINEGDELSIELEQKDNQQPDNDNFQGTPMTKEEKNDILTEERFQTSGDNARLAAEEKKLGGQSLKLRGMGSLSNSFGQGLGQLFNTSAQQANAFASMTAQLLQAIAASVTKIQAIDPVVTGR